MHRGVGHPVRKDCKPRGEYDIRKPAFAVAALAVPYKLTDKAAFTVGLQYATHNIGLVEDSHFWGTVGLTYTF